MLEPPESSSWSTSGPEAGFDGPMGPRESLVAKWRRCSAPQDAASGCWTVTPRGAPALEGTAVLQAVHENATATQVAFAGAETVFVVPGTVSTFFFVGAAQAAVFALARAQYAAEEYIRACGPASGASNFAPTSFMTGRRQQSAGGCPVGYCAHRGSGLAERFEGHRGHVPAHRSPHVVDGQDRRGAECRGASQDYLCFLDA